MSKTIIIDSDLFEFWKIWKKANTKYSKMCPGNTLSFPDPICKIIASKIDSSLIENHSSDKSYDFKGNIEMKSSCKPKGVTPFQNSQSNCSRIIFFRIINDKIEYYNITDEKCLNNINTDIKNGKKNITLINYITDYNIKHSDIIIKKE